MVPPKLKPGDHVRIIAPSHSLAPSFTQENKKQAVSGLEELGLTVSFGKHVEEIDEFETTSIDHRLEDLHEAYADPGVQAIIPARGGSSVTQLLKYIDYDLIKKNPKVFCGLSDITAISYAFYAKTGLMNYYGPHFTMLGTSQLVDYSFASMKEMLFDDKNIRIRPSEYYNNAPGGQQKIVNEGYWIINEGQAEGKSIGGNFLTTNFLLGSEFMPDISNSILFMEENHILDYKDVNNELQSILNHAEAGSIRGLIIGRFQNETSMSKDLLTKMVKSKKELENIPVVGNVDFGHTAPMLTLPVGGTVRLEVKTDEVKIEVKKH